MLHMLELQSVSKSFGTTWAVNDVSLTIKAGQVVGLLGPNGAGKTTTMRLIAGFVYPDNGDVLLNGISVLSQPELAQAQIGYLPENNPLYPELTVAEMLASSARIKQLTGIKLRSSLDSVVPAVGLTSVYNTPIRELSKGYKQRVGIALALLHQPDLLILDEPTEGLDPNQRAEIRTLLRNLGKDRTVIMSTHVMQEVVAVCDRIVIINQGQVVADGTQESLLSAQQGKSVVSVELEGVGVLKTLRAHKQLRVGEVEQVSRQRVKLTLSSAQKAPVPPVISQLAAQHSWTIWALQNQSQDLEHVFQELTDHTEGN